MNIYAFNNVFVGTAQKKYVKNAVKELKQIDPDVNIRDKYPDGVFTFQISCHREVLFFKLNESPPIFLRHLHPVDRIIYVPRDTFTPDAVVEGVYTLSDKIKPGKKLAVQARRIPGNYDYTLYTIKKQVDPVITELYRAQPVVKKPDIIISVFVVDSTKIDISDGVPCYGESCKSGEFTWMNVCFVGVSTPEQNLCEWSGGEVRFAREKKQKSSAEHKLLEAFEVFGIKTTSGKKALDLGSAPGGWTRILHQKGYQVTSVDRAPIDMEVSSLKGVRYVQCDAMHFRDKPATYDLLTNDINGDPIRSARSTVAVADVLKENSPFIMTLKLGRKKTETTIQKALKHLKTRYEIKGIKQLYHNKDEVTVWGLKKK